MGAGREDFSAARPRPVWSPLLDQLLQSDPFELVATPSGLEAIARQRVTSSSATAHCRTLDRLHLAALERLRLTRLITNDDGQAAAAGEAGVTVLKPR